MSYIPLSYLDLVRSLVLVALALGLLGMERVGLVKDLLVGTVRTFVQLALVGYVLQVVFDRSRWYLVLLMVAVMLIVAAQNAVSRQKKRPRGCWPIMLGSIAVGTSLTLALVCGLVLRVQPWYSPQYVIPIAGMIVGSAMNASALGVNRLSSEIELRRAEIEAALSLGATWQKAVEPARKEAVKAAMIPPISSMMVVGIVQLPGMMSGQIIGGLDPQAAVGYQIVVIYMIACAASLTSVFSVALTSRRFFTRSQQLVV